MKCRGLLAEAGGMRRADKLRGIISAPEVNCEGIALLGWRWRERAARIGARRIIARKAINHQARMPAML